MLQAVRPLLVGLLASVLTASGLAVPPAEALPAPTTTGRMTLQVVVTNDDGGVALPTGWTLEARGPATILSGRSASPQVSEVVVPAGTYALSAIGPDGYSGGWSCSGGEGKASKVKITPNAAVTCTLARNDRPAQLTLIKRVVNDSGGTAKPSTWKLWAIGPTTISGRSGARAVTRAPVSAGSYTLLEQGGPSGYTSGAWLCSAGTLSGATLTLGVGQRATCTITNDDQPATLTLVATVTNDDGGTATPGGVKLRAKGPSRISGTPGSPTVTGAPVKAGSYRLSVVEGPAGYTVGTWSCPGGGGRGSTLRLAVGSTVTCTVTLDDRPARLTLLKKVVNNDGGAAKRTGWVLSAAGPLRIAGASGSRPVSGALVPAGTYDLAESGGPSGYVARGWRCTAGVLSGTSVALGPGQSATCTITNDDQAARLTLQANVINDDGGTAAAVAWKLKATGPSTISGRTGSAAVTGVAVKAGVFRLSALGGPSGYTALGWTCEGGTLARASVALVVGSATTCTITFDDKP